MKALAKKALRWLVHRGMDVPPVHRQVRRLAHANLVPQKIWNRLPIGDRTFVISLPRGRSFRYRAEPGDAIGHAFYWCGINAWEAATIRVFLALAEHARCFVDIGANTGAYSLLACAVNPAMQVIAYEPVPRVHERLVENLALNGFLSRCRTSALAVSSTAGHTRLHVPRSLVPSSASLDPHGFRNVPGELIDVEVTTADADISPDTPVDLVKIDVEGFEDQVLQGMTRILADKRPVLICECNPDGPNARVEEILRDTGYTFFHVRDAGPVERPRIEPDPTQRFRNYACIPAENTAMCARLAGLARAGALG